MRHTWWRIPAFCSIAGWVDYHIKVWLFGRWTVVTLPDGSITIDDAKWAWLSFALMALTVVVGGQLICRSMTQREVFLSASVLVGINIAAGLLFMQINNMAAIYWSQFTALSGGRAGMDHHGHHMGAAVPVCSVRKGGGETGSRRSGDCPERHQLNTDIPL